MSLPSNLALNSVVHLHTLSVDLAANLLKEPASLDAPSSWHNLHLPAFAAARRQSSNLSFSTAASQPCVRAARAPRSSSSATASSVSSGGGVARTHALESAAQHDARKRAARQRAARSCSNVGTRLRSDIPTSPVSSEAMVGGVSGGGGKARSADGGTSVPSFSSATTTTTSSSWQCESAGDARACAPQQAHAAHMMAGVLRKRTRLTRRLVSRHFVLCGDTLYNFRDAQMNPTWRLPLRDAVVGTDLKKRLITVWDSKERRLQLVAPDAQQLRSWATALVHAAQPCLSASSCSTDDGAAAAAADDDDDDAWRAQ